MHFSMVNIFVLTVDCKYLQKISFFTVCGVCPYGMECHVVGWADERQNKNADYQLPNAENFFYLIF